VTWMRVFAGQERHAMRNGILLRQISSLTPLATPNVEVSGLRGFSRRSARLPGWAQALPRWRTAENAKKSALARRRCHGELQRPMRQ
jgi:hypothetical protein